jgi:hypothetical protein
MGEIDTDYTQRAFFAKSLIFMGIKFSFNHGTELKKKKKSSLIREPE